MESSWCGEDRWRIQWTIYSWWDVKQKAKYSGYLGTQGDPRRPNALSLRHQGHSVRAFHFVFELDRGGGGRGLRLLSFSKNIRGLRLNFYIQHYPVTICPWFGVNPFLWFIHLVNLSYGSCSLDLNHASVVSDIFDSCTPCHQDGLAWQIPQTVWCPTTIVCTHMEVVPLTLELGRGVDLVGHDASDGLQWHVSLELSV